MSSNSVISLDLRQPTQQPPNRQDEVHSHCRLCFLRSWLCRAPYVFSPRRPLAPRESVVICGLVNRTNMLSSPNRKGPPPDCSLCRGCRHVRRQRQPRHFQHRRCQHGHEELWPVDYNYLLSSSEKGIVDNQASTCAHTWHTSNNGYNRHGYHPLNNLVFFLIRWGRGVGYREGSVSVGVGPRPFWGRIIKEDCSYKGSHDIAMTDRIYTWETPCRL